MSFLLCNHETELINKPARFPPQGRFGVRDSDRLDHLSIQGTELPGASRDSPPLVLSDLLLLGAGRSHCVPAQLAEHLQAVTRGQKKHHYGKEKKPTNGSLLRGDCDSFVLWGGKRPGTGRVSKKWRSVCGVGKLRVKKKKKKTGWGWKDKPPSH